MDVLATMSCTSMGTAGGPVRCASSAISACVKEREKEPKWGRRDIIFCLPDDWLDLSATSISRQTTQAASNTSRLVTFACPWLHVLGLPSAAISAVCFTPTPSFHHKDAEPRPRRTARWTWASLNRPDIGSKS
ncbi:hypothetical protein V8C34DRAFT_208486 [Trichoderma compactum]